MGLQRIYSSELFINWKEVQTARLLFPFYPSHQQARDEFVVAVKRGKGYWLNRQGRWLFVTKIDQGDSWLIENLLVTADLDWQTALLWLETAARQKFKQALKIKLEANLILQQWLLDQGYQFSQGSWQKTLEYHTGLVLGGGGARGAFQIGVWQALEEKKIQFDVITGTSVGGLNGALIKQGDYQQAFELWEEIETDKVLEITFQEVEELDFSAQVDQLRTFIKTSLQQRGLSTQPLRRLLEERLELKKMQQGCPFYIVTTKVPAFQEVVIPLHQCSEKEIIDWLLASASFFPMMAMTRINDELYVDGGYRNNLPVDIALQQGPTELIIVDVHGPGVDKKYQIPAEVAEIKLESPWGLGDLLLFQQARASENIVLGYLVAKQAFGELQGYRYFFDLDSDFERLTRNFFCYLTEKIDCQKEMLTLELQKFFHRSVPLELLSLAFLEFFAYWLNISPVKVYPLAEFREQILRQYESPVKTASYFSVQEQIEDFIENHNVFSAYRRVQQLYYRVGSLEKAYYRWPIQTLLALFLRYLQETTIAD